MPTMLAGGGTAMLAEGDFSDVSPPSPESLGKATDGSTVAADDESAKDISQDEVSTPRTGGEEGGAGGDHVSGDGDDVGKDAQGEGGEEHGDGGGEPSPEQPAIDSAEKDNAGENDADHLIHWWCERQLARCLRKLLRQPEATPFSEPLDFKELGLDDFPEVVEEPMDLQSISEYLESGGYEDDDGLVNPEYFWEDVALCWSNFLIYYEEDQEVEAYKMALNMQKFAEELEDTFWADLEYFEQGLDQVDPALTSLAASANVATHAMEEAASVTWEAGGAVVEDLRDMLCNLFGWGGEVEQEVQAPVDQKEEGTRVVKSTALRAHGQRQSLLEFYGNLVEDCFPEIDVAVAKNDLAQIHRDFDDFSNDWPFPPQQFEDEEDAEEEKRAALFEGHEEKVPADKLLSSKDCQRRGARSISRAMSRAQSLGGVSRSRSLSQSRTPSRNTFRVGYSRNRGTHVSSRRSSATAGTPGGGGMQMRPARSVRDAAGLLKAPVPQRGGAKHIVSISNSAANSTDDEQVEAAKPSVSALKIMLPSRTKKVDKPDASKASKPPKLRAESPATEEVVGVA